jgi:uncharacterized protein YaeQ
MALKATIYKADLSVADLDRSVFADHALTIARHPSETDERMMVRLAAFALYSSERLVFGPGVSDADEPDLVERDRTGAIERWIEVGLPDERNLARACGRAREVILVAYGRGVDVWWKRIAPKLERLRNLRVLRLPEGATRALGELAVRTMSVSATIQEGHLLLAVGDEAVAIDVEELKPAAG